MISVNDIFATQALIMQRSEVMEYKNCFLKNTLLIVLFVGVCQSRVSYLPRGSVVSGKAAEPVKSHE
jgi:hypothetical protein